MDFTVVIPCFNAKDTIENALQSIAAQTLQPKEVVLIDDGSTDNTGQIVGRWLSALPIKYCKNEDNLGITKSLIKGVAIASGDWIARLDADDSWQKDHLLNISNAYFLNPDAVIISSPAYFFSSSGILLGKSNNWQNKDISSLLMWNNPFIASGTCFSRKTYHQIGGYEINEEWEDYNLNLRLAKCGKCLILPTYSVNYTLTDKSISRSISKKISNKKRWRTQSKAIKAFCLRKPFTALYCAVIGFLNIIYAK